MIPKGSTSVMARRVEPPDSLDYFPTPPWATRALFAHVLPRASHWQDWSAWEPACGEGHMAAVLSEFFCSVWGTDVFNYRRGIVGGKLWREGHYGVVDFLDFSSPYQDWIITNPPFKAACDFALHAIELARVGVAMLARTQWIESKRRYEALFRDHPPTIFAPFVERVPMVKGCWDPSASTATSYAWFVWLRGKGDGPPSLRLIPPGCRQTMTRADDIKRFAKRVPMPLEGAA